MNENYLKRCLLASICSLVTNRLSRSGNSRTYPRSSGGISTPHTYTVHIHLYHVDTLPYIQEEYPPHTPIQYTYIYTTQILYPIFRRCIHPTHLYSTHTAVSSPPSIPYASSHVCILSCNLPLFNSACILSLFNSVRILSLFKSACILYLFNSVRILSLFNSVRILPLFKSACIQSLFMCKI